MGDVVAVRQYREYVDKLFADAKHGERFGDLVLVDLGSLPTPERPRHGDAWGGWVYDAELMTLTYKNYELDLEWFTNPAKMLDMIFQVAGKIWATREVVGDLIAALDDVMYPQSTLCSGGVAKTLNVAKFLKKVAA
jgi:hypothetical protein